VIENVFRDNAEKYWAAGVPVMPLKVRSKAPILNEWTAYGRVAPTRAIQQHWLEAYQHSNIGLPFGPASGLCAIDIDTVDQDLVDIIMDTLPPSPWVRIGKKGCGLVYRWQGQKNFKIRSTDGMIVEMLGQGNQLVMPPSIHPDTGEAYTSNVHLWDVMDKIQPLPVDAEERLREALGVRGSVSLAQEGRSAPLRVVPQGERDIALVRQAGYLARIVLGIDKSAKFTLADAMTHMDTWVRDFTAGCAGDEMDPDKGVAKLLEFLVRDVDGGKTLPDGWDKGLTAEQIAHPTIAGLVVSNEGVRWTYSKAASWLTEEILLHPDDPDWALARVAELIEKVAKDPNFKELEFNGLIPMIDRCLGDIKISKTDLRRSFKVAKAGGSDQAADHEAVAREVIEDLQRIGELRWTQGTFWQWQGSCFAEVSRDDIYEHIAKTVKGNTLSKRHSDYKSITDTISILARKGLDEELETGVNFANGFLDADGVLHEHSPKFGKTFTMPFNYIPERASEAHKWLEYLERSWGDDPDYNFKVMALQEAFAATMFGLGWKYQRAMLLFGRGGTGKSQVLSVLRAMMPPSAVCTLPPELWNERFVMADMVGKTLNICGELPESGNISGAVFKQVIGGEDIRTERKQQDGFDFKPIATHWFASNFLPRSRDTSAGFTRRWLVLEFNRIVPTEERIPDFAEILVAEEREAIAAWAVQGLSRLLAQGEYTLPPSHLSRLVNVQRANNSVAAFLASTSKIRADEDKTADLLSCFDQYVWHCKEISRAYAVSFERFHQMVEELGYSITEYQDDILGHAKLQVHGLRMVEVPLAEKWRAASAS
jgi:putative DNA primase/helicase